MIQVDTDRHQVDAGLLCTGQEALQVVSSVIGTQADCQTHYVKLMGLFENPSNGKLHCESNVKLY